MNTQTVARKIGVSPKTIQRWIKQLDLPIERNDLGHYIFSDQDVDLFNHIHEQIQNGVAIKEINVPNELTKETIQESSTSLQPESNDRLWSKIKALELMLYQKADDVVSYQLLQHRKEMEELQNRIEQLELRIAELEQEKSVESFVPLEPARKKRPLRRGIISSFFGF